MNQKGLARLLNSISAAKRRNKDLSTRLVQVERSRDEWKRKALERGAELERMRKKRRRKPPPRTYTQEQWRQHDVIVKRIRAIPERTI